MGSKLSVPKRTTCIFPSVIEMQPFNAPGTPIPGLPGFRLCRGTCGNSAVVSFHSFRDDLLVKEFTIIRSELVSLDDALKLIRNNYRQQQLATGQNHPYFRSNVHDEPIELWPTNDVSPTGFRVLLVEKGLLVACGPTFILAFNTRLSCWFLDFVSVEPGKYLQLRLNAGLKFVADLNWNGSCVRATSIIRKNEQVPWKPTGAIPKLHLFSPKTSTRSAHEVCELYVSWFQKIYAKTSFKLYEFVRTPGGWAFKEVHNMPNESSGVYLPEMQVRADTQEMVVKVWENDHLV